MGILKGYVIAVLRALALVSIAVFTLTVLVLLLGADMYMQQMAFITLPSSAITYTITGKVLV